MLDGVMDDDDDDDNVLDTEEEEGLLEDASTVLFWLWTSAVR